jgi:hypothetical protein
MPRVETPAPAYSTRAVSDVLATSFRFVEK